MFHFVVVSQTPERDTVWALLSSPLLPSPAYSRALRTHIPTLVLALVLPPPPESSLSAYRQRIPPLSLPLTPLSPSHSAPSRRPPHTPPASSPLPPPAPRSQTRTHRTSLLSWPSDMQTSGLCTPTCSLPFRSRHTCPAPRQIA